MADTDLKVNVTSSADTSGIDQVAAATRNLQDVANRTGETLAQVTKRFADGPKFVQQTTEEVQKTTAALTLTRTEFSALANEIIRGNVNVRSIGTSLAGLGNPIAIIGIAMGTIVELISKASAEQDKWTDGVLKTTEEMRKLGDSILEAQDAFRETALLNKLPLNDAVVRAKEDVIKLKEEYALMPKLSEDDLKKWEAKGKEIEKAQALVDKFVNKQQELFITESKIAEQADLRNAKGNEEAEIVAKVNILETDTYNTLRKQGATKEEATRYSQMAGENLRQQLETQRGLDTSQRSYNVALKDAEEILKAIRLAQQVIQGQPFLGADQKQAQMMAAYRVQLGLVSAAMMKLKTDIAGGGLDPNVLEADKTKLQQLVAEYVVLQQKIGAGSHALQAELQTWANSFGSTMHQLAGTIEQTVGVALQSLNTYLTTGKFNAQQLLQSIIQLGLQVVEQMIIQRVVGAINADANVVLAGIAGKAIALAYAPAATAATIATTGAAASEAPGAVGGALAAIMAIFGSGGTGTLHSGGRVRRMHSGGLAHDEVPIIAQEGEIMIQRSVAQQPGMMDYLLGLNAGMFHDGGFVAGQRYHRGSNEGEWPFNKFGSGYDPNQPMINAPLDMPDPNFEPPPLPDPAWADSGLDPQSFNQLAFNLAFQTGYIGAPGTGWFNQGPTMLPTTMGSSGYPMALSNTPDYPGQHLFMHTPPKHSAHSGGLISRMHSGGAVGGRGGGGVHIYAFTDLKQLTKHMGSKDGQKIIFDTVKGRRIDLGIS